MSRIGWRSAAVVAAVLLCGFVARGADQFMKPTAEELKMKELPGYPGAAAVVLYREEITNDDLHVVQHYDRVKVLTEEGKKYANVELRFVSSTSDSSEGFGDDKTLGEISGRTIHPDGTVIPFSGKPYKKTIEKSRGVKYQAMVFTLPDAEVGSILEYRYATRINDNIYESPNWFIQGELYLKAAHYQWIPTVKELIDSKERPINTITWFPILPEGAKIVRTETPPTSSFNSPQQKYDLVVKEIPPQEKEDFMPPIGNYSYRVMFNFSSYRTAPEYWKSEGKEWSKKRDSFTGPNGELKQATQGIIAGAGTQDEKLRKIYAAVMTVENTNYTRERGEREDKVSGGKTNNAADVWSHKRGSSTQIAELFVGMARAAGMKAYLMLAPDRSEEFFIESWLSFNQFDATIAIVNVDGKDVFFDPGSRYCDYGHLAWEHTLAKGLRQTDAGTDFAQTPGEAYLTNKTARVANLTMDEHGEVTGKITMTFTGSPALQWRHRALRGDAESLKHGLQTMLEEQLPKTLEPKVTQMANVEDYDKPLVVTYEVKGGLGTPTGKRVTMPVDLFEAGSSATFPHEKRVQAVYFRYPQMEQDALRVNFAKGFAVEAVPEGGTFEMPGRAKYTMSVESTPNSFTTRRNYIMNEVLSVPGDYAALRKFYSQFEGKDQESVVLKAAAGATAGN